MSTVRSNHGWHVFYGGAAVWAVLTLGFTNPAVAQSTTALPTFKVAAQRGLDVCGLVPPATTTAQLRALVYALRDARQAGTLHERFGIATTPGSMNVYIFSDPKWCRPGMYGGPSSDDAVLATRATYIYGVRPGHEAFELGTIGNSDVKNAKRFYSKPYEKLFGGNY